MAIGTAWRPCPVSAVKAISGFALTGADLHSGAEEFPVLRIKRSFCWIGQSVLA